MATIIDGKTRIPFMRGMLVHHLIQRGVAHGEARDIANAVRDLLGKQSEVSRKEMVRLVEQIVHERSVEQAVGDLVFWDRQVTRTMVEREDGSCPFAKGLLARSLEVTGLAPEHTYDIASAIEGQIVDMRLEEIGHRDLERMAVELLSERHGEEYAERYRVWRARNDSNKPLVVLICGPSGAGKTTLAIALANLLDIPRVVATDDVRQMMRLTLTKELMPTLHASTYNAWEQIVGSSLSEDPVVAGYREQARTICVGVDAIIGRCIKENTSVVIDGVHLLPDFLNFSRYADSAFIAPLCIGLTDRNEYEKRFTRRAKKAPSRPMHRYLSYIEEIFEIQNHMIECYRSAELPVIVNVPTDSIVATAAMVVGEELADHADIRKIMESIQKGKGSKES